MAFVPFATKIRFIVVQDISTTKGALTTVFFDDVFFGLVTSVVEVTIDIKPGSDPNSINCNNDKESIAVAILTTDDFDAATVDHTTVTFEGASETHVDKKTGDPRRHEEDVDGDGDTDLVFHFRVGDTDFTCDSVDGTLKGETFGGQAIEGTDAVRMIDVFRRGPATPTTPKLLTPIAGQRITQNDPSIGCPLNPTRGFGFRIVFDWTDALAATGIAAYELFAKHQGATFPIVDRFVVGSEFTFTSCNAFVVDRFLTGWEWMVRAQDNAGNFGDFSKIGIFEFEPCRLADGSPCNAR